MRPIVAPLLLLLLALSARGGVIAGVERPVTAPAYGEAWGWQSAHPPASDGTDFLILSNDGSPGRVGLYAAVVDEEGAPRPVPARRIAAGAMRAAHAVWTGDAYLLLWADQTYAIYTARLDRDARLISGPSLLLTGHYDVLGLAWEGERALVLYTRGATDLHTKRVLRNGALAGTTGDQHGPAIGSGDFAQLAFLDGRYLIVPSACCTAERALYARALGRDGVPLDEPRVVQHPLRAFGLGAAGDRAWIAYSRPVDDGIFGNVPRVFVRVLAQESGRRRAARK